MIDRLRRRREESNPDTEGLWEWASDRRRDRGSALRSGRAAANSDPPPPSLVTLPRPANWPEPTASWPGSGPTRSRRSVAEGVLPRRGRRARA